MRERTTRPGPGLGSRLVTVMSVAALALLVVVGALTALQVRTETNPGEDAQTAAVDPTACPEIEGDPVDVAVAPAVAGVLEDLVDESGCDAADLRSADPAEVSALLVSDATGATDGEDGAALPEVWVPDSSLWLLRNQRGALPEASDDPDAEPVVPVTPEVVADSLAVSPVIIASKPGRDRQDATWREVISDPGLKVGDPLEGTAALTPLVGARAEGLEAGISTPEIAAELFPLAQRVVRRTRATPTDEERLRAAINGVGGAAAVAEQTVIAADLDPGEVDLAVPETGTLVLDYPAVATTRGERRGDAFAVAAWLGAIASSPEGIDTLADAGFRGPLGRPLERGLPEATALQLRDLGLPTDTLADWTRLTTTTRTVSVVDVSASMAESTGDDTRIGLAIEALDEAARLSPATAEAGLWAFSLGLGESTDYVALVPADPLGLMDSEQRLALASAREGLRDRVGDGTGSGTALYDTVLAAYRAASDAWLPDAVNSVVVLTDGADDDPDGVGLDELVAELEGLADPERPVAVIAVAIGPDADVEALTAISTATGGATYVADPAGDLAEVVREALAARAA